MIDFECPHWDTEDIGTEATGENIVQCTFCKEVWNEGAQ